MVFLLKRLRPIGFSLLLFALTFAAAFAQSPNDLLHQAQHQLSKAPDRALPLAQRAIEESAKLGDEEVEGRSWLVAAHAYDLIHNPLEATQAAHRAQRLLQGDAPVQKEIAKRLLHCYGRMGALEKAREQVHLLLDGADPAYRSKWLVYLADLDHVQGYLSQSREKLRLSGVLENGHPNPEVQLRAQRAHGILLQQLEGDYPKAREVLEQTLTDARKVGNRKLIIHMLITLSGLDYSDQERQLANDRLLEAVQLGSELNDPYEVINAQRNYGAFLFLGGEQDSAEVILKSILPRAQELQSNLTLGLTLQDLGRLNMTRHHFKEALIFLHQGVKHAEEHQYIFLEAYGYRRLASVYNQTDEPIKAKEFANKALELAKEAAFQDLLLMIFGDFASIASKDGDYETAVAYMKQALDNAIALNRKDVVLQSQASLAQYYYFGKKVPEAFYWMDQALNNKEALEAFPLAAGEIYARGGQLYRNVNPEKGIACFKKELEYAKLTERTDLQRHAYYFLTLIYERKKDYQEALRYQRLLGAFKDSLSTAQSNKEINELKAAFDSERKDRELDDLKVERKTQEQALALQQAELLQRRQLLIGLIAMILIAAALIYLLFNRFQLRQKAERLTLVNQKMTLQEAYRESQQKLEIESLKAQFFADVSHELRTPLTLIKGPLDQLLANPTLDHREQLQMMGRNADRLMNLVNETLDLSKIEHGYLTLDKRRVDLAAFVGQRMKAFQTAAEQKGLRLQLKDHTNNLFLDLDPGRMEKVLLNLLGNAVNFTPEGGLIEVTLNARKEVREGKEVPHILVEVFNSGEGIPAEHLPHLFDRFYRVDDTDGRGTGIGLHLSKELVALHGGTLEVRSEIGVGNTFSILLPVELIATDQGEEEGMPLHTDERLIQPNGHAPTEAMVHPSVDQQQHVILLVDDQPDMLLHLQDVLGHQYHILTAPDGEAAIALAKKRHIDLMICDVMMPGKDGIQVTKLLKNQFATSHIPIILLTAKASSESRLVGLEAGADDYLGKPFHAPELLARIKNLIAQRQQLRRRYVEETAPEPAVLIRHQKDEEFLDRSLEVVTTNLQSPNFSVERFCQELALNRTSVHLKLKALTGLSASQYIRHIRVQKAATLLREGHDNMAFVAESVGFNNRQSFNKAFREQFEMTPSEFLKG